MKYDLAGKTFGRLTVIEPIGNPDLIRSKWRCKCECGGEKDVMAWGLLSENTKSCGCLHRDNGAISSMRYRRRHGATKSHEYRIWRTMKDRCYREKCGCYETYGGRGIRVCDRWFNSFENFIEDMGLKPSPKHSIDRINNDGNYEPGNCRWATSVEQGSNKRNTRYVDYKGEKMTVIKFAELIGLKYGTVLKRLKNGMTPEQVASAELRTWG